METVRRVCFVLSGRRFLPAVRLQLWAAVLLGVLLSGCGSIVSSITGDFAEGLSDSILNSEDPELVREALPSYLLLLDSVVAGSPDNTAALSAAAQLYAVYGASLVDDPQRSAILTTKGREYGVRAICTVNSDVCELEGITFDQYAEIIGSFDDDEQEITALYSYSVSSLAWIRSNADDYNALANLPKVEFSLEHLMALGPGEYESGICLYLGILNTLRPPALGGKPDVAQEWFERGIALSEGKDLSMKVEYARSYARLLYDRELHDRLLNEVLEADVKQPDLTLFNILAQDEAHALLASADDYF